MTENKYLEMAKEIVSDLHTRFPGLLEHFRLVAEEKIADALESVVRERDAEWSNLGVVEVMVRNQSTSEYVGQCEKQLSEKEEELLASKNRENLSYQAVDRLQSEVVYMGEKITTLEAEIERLKMLTNFPESSFKWRWAKAQEEIAELRETLNDYETVVADMYESKIASLSQKLEKAVQGFKMLVDRASIKTDDYYAKYPDYKKKIMKDSSPYSGELQTAKYFLKELSEDKK